MITSSSSSPVSEPIISDSRLRKLSFTGSTEVGRKLISQSASNVLKVSMGLGGNAPFLVVSDADLDQVIGPLIDSGQRQKVPDLVSDAVSKGAEAMIVGGQAVAGAGYSYEPTVPRGVSPDARVLNEEIFGPVAPVA